MKLLVDLLPCQAASRFRGIGRYTLSLTRAMARDTRGNELTLAANGLYPEQWAELREELIRLVPPGALLPCLHPSLEGVAPALYASVAQTLGRQAYEVVQPHAVLYPSVFEGWCERDAVPLPEGPFPSMKRVAVLHDFTPLVFSDTILNTDAEYKAWYLHRVRQLKEFDFFLTISESTRQDAVRLAEIEPDRIVNISAAADPQFRQTTISPERAAEIFTRLGISKPFIFCAGSIEHHKNGDLVLQAFAKLPPELRQTYQVVLTHNGDQSLLMKKSRAVGLPGEALVSAGRLNDSDLIALYNLCKLFVFPSLYEGAGLPVLEAMACGAPVICSNNSSLPEVAGRTDVLFDASSAESIAMMMHRVLTTHSFREELKEYGLKRAKEFTWERTADRAWQAISALCKSGPPVSRKFFRAPSRCRVAFLSPLPPQKSGISDYSAELLPALAKHCDLDLFVQPALTVGSAALNSFRVYPWTDLLERRADYDTVVYHVGNSEFHLHMLDLLRELPGVVVLHDFYLSNLPLIEEFLQGKKGMFLSQMDESHGLRGMVHYLKNGVSRARSEWPINWNVLKHAQVLVVHSNHAETLLRKYYGRGWLPNVRVIRHLRVAPADVPPEKRNAVRGALGFSSDDLVFCSFGFIADTKLNHLALEAFANLNGAGKQKTHMVFVGELEGGEYGWTLLKKISEYGLSSRVRITGCASAEEYERYLIAADCAVELRSHSRREIRDTVLDCMAHQLPVILNADGSLQDYNAEDVVRLADPVGLPELTRAMTDMASDRSLRDQYARRARNRVMEDHHPEAVARQYAEVISEAASLNERQLFAPLVKDLFQYRAPPQIVSANAQYAAANVRLRNQPRLLIDVTIIAGSDGRSGIQRVVKGYIRAFMDMQDPSFHVELVRLVNGDLVRACRFAEVVFGIGAGNLGHETPVDIRPGDILFMLDSSWDPYEQFLPHFKRVRQMGGKIATIIHDLIPLRFPGTCEARTPGVFANWLQLAVQESDDLVCVSRTVADDLQECIRTHRIRVPRNVHLLYVHNGADIPVVPRESTVRHTVAQLTDPAIQSPLFLMVGTLEPRKGHAFALDAFDLYWSRGGEARLCIVGKVGWNVEPLVERIRNHEELNHRLYFVENATDGELARCYARATALLAASKAEGFGLPVVEAALHHVPALVSDIPVFREVGGDGATYFSLDAPEHLAAAVRDLCRRQPEELKSAAGRIRIQTWKESAQKLRDALFRNETYKVIGRTDSAF
jgi:glycosyltransferase involved in cell wall biosynthesis